MRFNRGVIVNELYDHSQRDECMYLGVVECKKLARYVMDLEGFLDWLRDSDENGCLKLSDIRRMLRDEC